MNAAQDVMVYTADELAHLTGTRDYAAFCRLNGIDQRLLSVTLQKRVKGQLATTIKDVKKHDLLSAVQQGGIRFAASRFDCYEWQAAILCHDMGLLLTDAAWVNSRTREALH